MEHTKLRCIRAPKRAWGNANEAKIAVREATEVGRTVTAIAREIKIRNRYTLVCCNVITLARYGRRLD